MEKDPVLQTLENRGVVITDDHFVYKSRRHGSAYVNKDGIYPDTRLVSSLCIQLASFFQSQRGDIQVVVGPEKGGIILSQWTAHHLTGLSGHPVKAVFAEKAESGDFVFKRGYGEYIPGQNVLIVEDVLTTGGSVAKVVKLVKSHGGNVMGVSAICNRGNVTPETIDSPVLSSVCDVDLESWPAEECPLCRDKVPVNTEYGHGKAFLAEQKS